MRIKVKRVALPSDLEGLAQWVRRSYGAITSFLQVQQANTYNKRVGIGKSQN